MRKLLQKITLVIGAIALSTTMFAQDYTSPRYAKYGDDPSERKNNIIRLNTFTEAFKTRDFGTATVALKELLELAPKSSQNLYALGTSIYKRKIATAKSKEEVIVYIDSIMILHDLRLEHFADDAKRGSGYILTEKFKDYINYKKDNIDDLVTLANTAIKAAGAKLDVEVVPAYYNVLVGSYLNDNYSPEELIKEYDFLSTTLANLAPSEERDEALKSVEQLFIQSGVASCENLEMIYKPKFEATPDDVELIKKISIYLARNRCESDFQNAIAEKSYAIEPNAAAAVMLAMAFEKRGDKDRAAEYMAEAISLETDLVTKSEYTIRAAGTALQNNNPRTAADYAKSAIELNSESGTAYLLLAQAYAVGASSSCSGFNNSAVYWLVVDTLVKARSLSEGDEVQLKSINDLIRTYSGYFPKTEDMFFSDPPVQDGDGYTVNCGWISGRTTARGR